MLSAAETEILSTSFSVASLALLGSLPPAIACAFLLARPFRGSFLLDGLAHLPDAKKDPAGFATGMQKVALSMQVASTAQSAVSETIKAFGEGTKGAAHNIS